LLQRCRCKRLHGVVVQRLHAFFGGVVVRFVPPGPQFIAVLAADVAGAADAACVCLNRKLATALRLTTPPALLVRAEQVIE